MPFSDLEKQVFKQSHKIVAGIDEAGRGAWAGPVAAAVVAVNNSNNLALANRPIRDSKHLSSKQREEVFEWIKNNPSLEWKVSFVWPKVIDRINIWQATLLAWKRCLQKLNPKPDFLFIDGKLGIPRLKIRQEAVVKGDERIFLLSLASVAAKVSRDNLMRRLDSKFFQYQFAKHKGYGVKLHLSRLKKHGPCLVHRKSFRPVFSNMSFRDKVYYIVSRIPKGETLTYREVAEEIGSPQSFRAVGNALNRNYNPEIPCHRVVRSDGRTGGYNKGAALKQKLIRQEKDDILKSARILN